MRETVQSEYYDLASALPEGRKRLTALVRGSGDVIRIDDAVRILALDRTTAAKTLARWTTQGWLRRVGHGAYVAAGLDSLESAHVLEDAWVLVPALFEPCYVGGWTAAEHWDLTEQIFNDVFVVTARSLRSKLHRHHGVNFRLKHTGGDNLFGTKAVWRSHTKVPVSDVHRTIIDMLDDPSTGGGIHHVAECLGAYLRRPDRSERLLIEYAERLGNGAVFKRLGFLAEASGDAPRLVDQCARRLTKGNAKLDPALECPQLVSRWQLSVPTFSVGGPRS
jgi:predicted transcriptional regulator of viral defense system